VKRRLQFRGLLSQRLAYPELEGQEIDSFFRAIVSTLHPPPPSHPRLAVLFDEKFRLRIARFSSVGNERKRRITYQLTEDDFDDFTECRLVSS